MSRTFMLRAYLSYWLDAVDAHSLHSPFCYDFFQNVVNGKDTADFSIPEQLRAKLLDNRTPLLPGPDFGSGPRNGKRERTIRDVAQTSLSPAKFSQLYARAATYLKARNIVELGTSFGINTLYLATAPGSRITTFEGSPSVAAVAKSTFAFAGSQNICVVEGNIDQTLPLWLEGHEKIDLAFIDANHRYEPTLRYFREIRRHTHPKGAVIIDDIHYSPEMQRAWEEIRSDSLVYTSIDLFRCGLVFFDPSLNKQHVVMQF